MENSYKDLSFCACITLYLKALDYRMLGEQSEILCCRDNIEETDCVQRHTRATWPAASCGLLTRIAALPAMNILPTMYYL